MQLNELFEQYAIETIEEKTNIPKEKLADLKEGDWSKFKRAQALGFLNIFEREFGVNLDEVKDECKSFFEQQQPLNSSARIDFIDSQVAKSSNGGVVSKIIAVVTLVALGYAGWYYYNKSNQSGVVLEQNSTQSSSVNTQSNNQTEPVKATIEENSTKEQDKKEDLDKSKSEQNIINETQSSNNQKFDIVASNSDKQESTNMATLEQTNISADPNKTKSVKDEVDSLLNEANRSINNKESNSTQEILALSKEANSSTNMKLEQNVTIKESNSTYIAENNLSLDKNNTLSNTTMQEENGSIKLLEKVKIAVKSKKLWLGIYNLDSGKKVSKIIKKGTTLDLTNGKLAIITGHSRLNLVTNNETKEFKNRGKMYLLLSQNEGIKVITKKEYKELTKNRAW